MNKTLSFRLWIILALLATFSLVRSQSEKDKMLDRRIPEFEVTHAPTSLAVQRLARSSNVPIGMEAVPDEGQQTRTIDLNLKGSTVRDLLACVVEKDSQYAWQQAGSVVNVFPKQTRDPLLEVIVKRFEVTNVNKEEALRALENSVEVKRLLTITALQNRTLKSLPGDSEHGLPQFSLSLKRSSVRNILNAIMVESKSKSWLFFRHGPEKQSFSLTVR